MKIKYWRMPACTARDIEPLLAVVDSFRGDNYDKAWDFTELVTPYGLCQILHGMRRWYSYQTHPVARKLLSRREALKTVMDLSPPIGAYRGFKIEPERIEGLEEGDLITLPVQRNGGCSSWTLHETKAHRFSGTSRGKIGVVVRLADGRGVVPFIAPPCRSEPWFNTLYQKTIGRSFRFKEQEYAIQCSKITAEIVRIKG